MNCIVAFDLAQTGFQHWGVFALLGGAFVLTVLSLVLRDRIFPWKRTRYQAAAPAIGLIILVFVTFAFSHTYFRYLKLSHLEAAGQLETIDGVVTNFSPATRSKRDESFTVGAKTFRYAAASVMAGFHQPSNEGGPVRSAQHVRIAYAGPDIVKLEICS